MSGVIILGAGGHAKVIADILISQGTQVRGFLDDDSKLWGETRLGLPVLGAIDPHFEYEPDGLIIGIGDNLVRRSIAQRLSAQPQRMWRNALHPQATIARSAQLGRGIVVGAGAVVNPDSVLGDHVIINTGATVDHDCAIGDFVHVAPGAHLAGGVMVGEGALIGIGSSLIPNVRIGEWTTVGAGSVVISDLSPRFIAFGVPAKSQE
jgi:sugar O-acyltransferase (sialic acid O-acetyltransferase NeuD family)